ncbi:energy transducer TonB [Flavobacterium ovatum]|uniref:energy transducer TonB n=1 Tax=Flavobacterium ovatum TaxID=1928857 RepID=UPI00344D5AFF
MKLILPIMLLLSTFAHTQIRLGNNKVTFYKDGKPQKQSLTVFDSCTVIKDQYITKDEYVRSDYNKTGKLVREITFKTIKHKDYSTTSKVTEYYDNGDKKLEGETNSTGPRIKISKIEQFWNTENIQTITNGNGDFLIDNDSISIQGKFVNGLKDGFWHENDSKKSISHTEKFKKGTLISGIFTDNKGNESKYANMEEKPTPKKGIEDFYSYISNNFIITNRAKLRAKTGKIYATFVIDKEGQVIKIKILRGLGEGLDEELIKVLSSYERWIPGKRRGQPVNVLYSIPITIAEPQNKSTDPLASPYDQFLERKSNFK